MVLTGIAANRFFRGKWFNSLWLWATFFSEASDNEKQVEGLLLFRLHFPRLYRLVQNVWRISVGTMSILFWLRLSGCSSLGYLRFHSYRTVEVGRDIWRSFSTTCLIKQRHLEWIAQDHVHVTFEELLWGKFITIVLCLIVWWLWHPGWDCICSAWTRTWVWAWFFYVPSWYEAGDSDYRRYWFSKAMLRSRVKTKRLMQF